MCDNYKIIILSKDAIWNVILLLNHLFLFWCTEFTGLNKPVVAERGPEGEQLECLGQSRSFFEFWVSKHTFQHGLTDLLISVSRPVLYLVSGGTCRFTDGLLVKCSEWEMAIIFPFHLQLLSSLLKLCVKPCELPAWRMRTTKIYSCPLSALFSPRLWAIKMSLYSFKL